jgi:hypothetical protein
MKALKMAVLLCSMAAIFTACTKELSFEDPIGAQGQGPIIGNNCVIAKIVEYDTITRTGLTAINYEFNSSTGRLNNFVEYDSIGQNVVLNANFSYNADTVHIDASQYFVVDNSGRVKKFHGLQNPYDPLSPELDYEYFYDGAGRIIKRSVTDLTLLPTPFLQSTYSYSGNNMTGIAVILMDGMGNTFPLINTTLSYQFDRVPRNFMNILPDCDELAPYMGALNMGLKSLNPVNKIDIVYLDPFSGTPITTTTTLYNNYRYSRDGYVLSVDMSGDDIPALPFAPGRNNFSYFCR